MAIKKLNKWIFQAGSDNSFRRKVKDSLNPRGSLSGVGLRQFSDCRSLLNSCKEFGSPDLYILERYIPWDISSRPREDGDGNWRRIADYNERDKNVPVIMFSSDTKPIDEHDWKKYSSIRGVYSKLDLSEQDLRERIFSNLGILASREA